MVTTILHQCSNLSAHRSWDSSLLGLADGFHHPVDADLIFCDGLWSCLAGGRAFLEPLLHSVESLLTIYDYDRGFSAFGQIYVVAMCSNFQYVSACFGKRLTLGYQAGFQFQLGFRICVESASQFPDVSSQTFGYSK